MAYNLLQGEDCMIQHFGKTNRYLFFKENMNLINKNFFDNRFDKLKSFTYDEFIKTMIRIKKIELEKTDWSKSEKVLWLIFQFNFHFCYHI